MKRKIMGMLAILGVMVGSVALASPASAHHPLVTGVAVCNEANGLFDVTWTVKADADRQLTWELTEIVYSGGAVKQSNPLVRPDEQDFVLPAEQIEGGETVTLKVTARWSNGVKATRTGTVTAEGDCQAPPPECDDPCKLPAVQTNAPAVTKCMGVRVGQVLNSVVVPRGESCTLVDSWVNGNVTSKGGRNVTLADVTVRGDIRLQGITGDVTVGPKGGDCRFDPLVGGSVIVTDSHNVKVCHVTACKDIVIRRNDGRITLRDNVVRRIVVVGNREFVSDGRADHPRQSVIRLIDNTADSYVIRKNAPRKVQKR